MINLLFNSNHVLSNKKLHVSYKDSSDVFLDLSDIEKEIKNILINNYKIDNGNIADQDQDQHNGKEHGQPVCGVLLKSGYKLQKPAKPKGTNHRNDADSFECGKKAKACQQKQEQQREL